MSQATFVGVKNISGGDKKLMYGGDFVRFAKDEVKVVDAATGIFLLGRTAYVSEDVPGLGQKAVVKAIFKKIPLHEALKFAKEPENKSVAEAHAEAKKEADLVARIKADLVKEGWKAPVAEALKDPKASVKHL